MGAGWVCAALTAFRVQGLPSPLVSTDLQAAGFWPASDRACLQTPGVVLEPWSDWDAEFPSEFKEGGKPWFFPREALTLGLLELAQSKQRHVAIVQCQRLLHPPLQVKFYVSIGNSTYLKIFTFKTQKII